MEKRGSNADGGAVKRRVFLSLVTAAGSFLAAWSLRVSAFASGAAPAQPPFQTAQQVADAIQRRGSKAFLTALTDDEVEHLYSHIGSGHPDWIALAPMLADGADGADAEGLSIELAKALPKNPTAVLRVLDPAESHDRILATPRVCSIPFIEKVPRNYKSSAIRAVSEVQDPALQATKQRCLAMLSHS
jgi:hypothetical protein